MERARGHLVVRHEPGILDLDALAEPERPVEVHLGQAMFLSIFGPAKNP
jgi:hypothetical protein